MVGSLSSISTERTGATTVDSDLIDWAHSKLDPTMLWVSLGVVLLFVLSGVGMFLYARSRNKKNAKTTLL